MAIGARLASLLHPLCGAEASEGVQECLNMQAVHPKAGRVVCRDNPGGSALLSEAQHYSLSPLCSGSDPALGLHIGKPQPFLTSSLLPKQLQPQLLSSSWMLDLKTCDMWGSNSIG